MRDRIASCGLTGSLSAADAKRQSLVVPAPFRLLSKGKEQINLQPAEKVNE